MVRRTPCACSPAVDDSVLIVVVSECIVVSGLDTAIGGWVVFQYSVVSLELNVRIYHVCEQVLEACFLACEPDKLVWG